MLPSIHPPRCFLLPIRYTIIPGLSSSLHTAWEPRGLHRLSESFSPNDSENQTTQQKALLWNTTKLAEKIVQYSRGIRAPEIPNTHWKPKIPTLHLHRPREACLTSVVRNRHHHSRSRSTAFEGLSSPFMNCFLETATSLCHHRGGLGNSFSSWQIPWYHQWDSLSETGVEAKTFAWNILTLKGQNRSHITDKVHFTGKGKEFRVQIIQISSWLVLRQECNRQSSLRKQLRDDYSAVVAVKNKSKVQGNNWVFNLHTTWEFACMQMNNRIF